MSVALNTKTEEKNPAAQFPKLEFTENNLMDVIKMINDGNIVALYTKSACRAFHNISSVNLSERRVVYLNCNSHQELLAQGEWEWYIHKEIPTVNELEKGDSLRNRIIEQKEVPHKTYVTLGY